MLAARCLYGASGYVVLCLAFRFFTTDCPGWQMGEVVYAIMVLLLAAAVMLMLLLLDLG